jgi:hypothetical protein
MARTRISTTVDTDRLELCRRTLGVPDSELVDRALAALARELLTRQERAALAAAPYDEDPDLDWQAPAGPDLPYAGEIPEEVMRLAAERRARYGRRA